MAKPVSDRSRIARGGVRSRIERRRHPVEPEGDESPVSTEPVNEPAPLNGPAPGTGTDKLSDRLIRRQVADDRIPDSQPPPARVDEDRDSPTKDEQTRAEAAREQADRDEAVRTEQAREQAAAEAERDREAAAQAGADHDEDHDEDHDRDVEPAAEDRPLADQEDPVTAARRRFGGFDAGATVAGMLAAFGLTILIGGLLGAVGSIGYQLDVQRDSETLSSGGLIAGLATLVIAFLFGGWVAGRMARFDGGLNGLMTAVGFFALAAVLSAAGALLGERYDVFRDLHVPRWFSDNATSGSAILSGVIALAMMLLAALIGGKLGDHYHVRVDKRIAAQQRTLAQAEADDRDRVAESTDRHPRRRSLA
jgi:hypothetical protein